MVGIPGSSLDAISREFLSEMRPNGVILFSRNIESPEQVVALNNELQAFAKSIELDPLFISVDQEGGRVRRLREPFSSFPSSWEMVSSEDPETKIQNFARQTAIELRLAGFNLDFVPVLDVVDEGIDLKATVIGDRSFGSEPYAVARFGSIVVEEMRFRGIIPCAKHFPGHGATTVDSHLDLPVDDRPMDELQRRDLIPFKQAANIGIEMMMTAHVLFPRIDEDYPATMSKRILKGLLREELGYQGVVITDDLEMGAVARRYSTQTCVVESFSAGADVLLICNSFDKAIDSLTELRRAFEKGELHQSQLLSSVERIRSLKQRFVGSFKNRDSENLLQELSRSFSDRVRKMG